MIIPDINLEKSLWGKGLLNIAGVDEAGKGPLAGPVTAAAVVIHSEQQIVNGVRDSKKMNATQREKAYEEICKMSSAYGIGVIHSDYIDQNGIDFAVREAMISALIQLERKFKLKISYVIVDGSKTKPLMKFESLRIKKGGLYHYTISAASVLAKVTRDRMMKTLSEVYPNYGFDKHSGYGTIKHLQALKQYGSCPIHRKSYSPINRLTSKVLGN